MESTKNRKKGLLSIVALIVCLAMLTVGTYAWFTDTATVGGNQVMAGNLDAAIVMTGTEIKEKDVNAVLPETVAVGQKVKAAEGKSSVFDGAELVKVVGTSAEDSYYDVTGLKANKVQLGNLEPGQIHPVVLDVYNKGELAIGFTAGFNLPYRDEDNKALGKTSYTGLETLGLQATNKLGTWEAKPAGANNFGGGNKYKAVPEDGEVLTTDEFDYRLEKLLNKQYAEKVDDDVKTAMSTYLKAYDGKSSIEKDNGKKLEGVLEVYYLTMQEYKDQYISNGNVWKENTAEKITAKTAAKRKEVDNSLVTPEKMNSHLIGTIDEIINYQDEDWVKNNVTTPLAAAETALKTLKTTLTTKYEGDMKKVYTDPDYLKAEKEYYKLVEKKERVANIEETLMKSSSGYCVPAKALVGASLDADGKLTVKLTTVDGVDVPGKVSDIGKAVYLIKMSEDADNLYQNAYIELDMGVTANQVKWDRDGVNNYLYDPSPEPPAQRPVAEPTPELETEPETVPEP